MLASKKDTALKYLIRTIKLDLLIILKFKPLKMDLAVILKSKPLKKNRNEDQSSCRFI